MMSKSVVRSALLVALGFTVLLVLFPNSASAGQDISVTLYEHRNHKCCYSVRGNSALSFAWSRILNGLGSNCGVCDKIHLPSITTGNNGCWTSDFYSEMVSSIDTHDNCVVIWEHKNCQGASMVVQPGSPCHSNLNDCHFEDRLSSVSGCDEQSAPTTSAPTPTTTEPPAVVESVQCPAGSYVQAIRVKPGYIYGLELDCHEPGAETKISTILAANGTSVARNLLSQCINKPTRGLGFNWTNNNRKFEVQAYCTNIDQRQYQHKSPCEDWREAVCGIRLTNRGSRITYAESLCCTLPNPGKTCTPTDRYEVIKQCDNIAGYTDMDCSFQRSVGIGTSNSAESGGSRQAEFYASMNDGRTSSQGQHSSVNSETSTNVGVNAGVQLGSVLSAGVTAGHSWSNGKTSGFSSDLSSNFGRNLGNSSSTGYNWGQTSSSSLNEEHVDIVAYTVSPGVRTVLEQVVGTCGFLEVRTSNLRKTDFDKDGHRHESSISFKPTTSTLPPPIMSEEDVQMKNLYRLFLNYLENQQVNE